LNLSNKRRSKVLAVFAHADDETLLAGALLAKLVQDGYLVRILCLAPGDDDRTARLHSAGRVLGVEAVETLRYTEGAMWPNGEWKTTPEIGTRLSIAPIADLVGGIGGRIAESGPDIVITHSPYGDYGHPDHAAVSTAVRATVQKSSNTQQSPIELYLLEWPRWVVRLNARLMKLGGRDTRRMGEDGRFNLNRMLHSEIGTLVKVDVAGHLEVRREASRLYAAEIAKGPLPMRLLEMAPHSLQRFFLGTARLRRVDTSIESLPLIGETNS